MENKNIQATPKQITFVLIGIIGLIVLIVDRGLFLTIILGIGAVWLIWKKLPLKRDHKWLSIIGVIVLSLITAFIIISTGDKGGEEQSLPTIAQPQVKGIQREAQEKKSTPEQKEIKSFLTEIGILAIKSGKGNDDVEKMGIEFQRNGLPLPYAISAQLIFESVLEEIKKLKVPLGGEGVKNYFIESVQYQLNGVKTIRESLEEGPINEKKLWQGLETYNKAMLSTARSTEEINKLKAKVGLQ